MYRGWNIKFHALCLWKLLGDTCIQIDSRLAVLNLRTALESSSICENKGRHYRTAYTKSMFWFPVVDELD